jgi:two-component system, sensor histidine kinase and response regulator
VIPRQILDDQPIRVLLVTPDAATHTSVAQLADQRRRGSYIVDWLDNYPASLQAIADEKHDVYLIHQHAGDHNGIDLVTEASRNGSTVPLIMLTDTADHDLGLEALEAGATDSLALDNIDAESLFRSIRHALVHAQTRAELIAARDEAEAATAEKTKFLSNLSHDLRTPLNAIIGMTEIVLRDQLTETHREALETVLIAGETLLDMADRLVDIPTIESGTIDLDPAPFNIRDALTDVVRIFGLQARQKDIFVGIDVPTSLPEVVTADEARFQQVLIDLVSNAIKFTERGTVTLAVTDLYEHDGSSYLRVSVEDNGAGIPADLQPKLFDRARRATTASGSTGLGVVHNIVTAMGGMITVNSKVGRGTRFDFEIKVGTVDDAAGAARPGEAGGGVVLVMSSDPEGRRTIESDLLGAGLEPLIVGDIGAAAEAVTQPIDAIVLDTAYKPFEVATTLMERAGRVTPVTLLVPSAREGDEPRCREAGVKGYVEKPTPPGVLADVVKATIAATRAGDTNTLFTADSLLAGRPSMKILVVDDVETNLALTVRMLSERGHVATAVRSGIEAIDAFEQYSFDVVLMDLQMPGLDGFDTTAALRAEEVLRGITRTPIVALTGHTTTEERDRCVAAGMDGFLSKPVRPDALFAAVEQFISSAMAA